MSVRLYAFWTAFSLVSTPILAAPPVHEQSEQEYRSALQLNQNLTLPKAATNAVDIQPVPDTSHFAYVLMSARDDGDSEVTYLRKTIASNLPADVKLVILATKSNAESIKSRYAKWIPKERLIIASDNDSANTNGFWARDSFPVPVWDSAAKNPSLVALSYYRPFRSGKTIAASVGAKITTHEQIFVGGNLLADEDGNCFSVNSKRMFGMTAEAIRTLYGCKTATLLNHLTGLGDVDEVIKPLSNHRMLTNNIAYKTQLEDLGYTVTMLPSLSEQYRTYVNALVVGDRVFMPAYGVAKDQVAKAVYEELGYKVFLIPSNSLSDDLHGSVHCQTMAYPDMAKDTLLNLLQSEEL